jgi:riboflavin kinase/FMN adenylyltransferase
VKTAVSVGHFDAVHVGHLALVHKARELVGQDGCVEMWSFDPSPMSVINPRLDFGRLTTFDQRTKLLLDAGADDVIMIKPNLSLLSQTPEGFVSSICSKSNPDFFVEGKGFRFGENRSGNNEILRQLGKQYNFTSIEVGEIEVELSDGVMCCASSTLVRSLMLEGRVEDATRVLGRPVQVQGNVVKGNQRGQTMGIPTANLVDIDLMLPKSGIYAGTAIVDDETYISAISIGTNPTFGSNGMVVCEVHLIGYDGPLNHYGWRLSVNINNRIRDQLKFDSQEKLREAILSDIETSVKLVESNR